MNPLMVTTEMPTDDDFAVLAKATQTHERVGLIGKWINQGKVSVVPGHKTPGRVVLRVADEQFEDESHLFPSDGLFARLSLALNSGRSDRGWTPIEGYKAGDTISFQRPGPHSMMHVWATEALATGYQNVAKLTATVKNKKAVTKWP